MKLLFLLIFSDVATDPRRTRMLQNLGWVWRTIILWACLRPGLVVERTVWNPWGSMHDCLFDLACMHACSIKVHEKTQTCTEDMLVQAHVFTFHLGLVLRQAAFLLPQLSM